MTDSADYVPPKVWTWNKSGGGRFANINRPISGADARQGTAGRPSSAAALFAGDTERREGHGDAGGVAGARPQRRGIRCVADQDRRRRSVRQRLRRRRIPTPRSRRCWIAAARSRSGCSSPARSCCISPRNSARSCRPRRARAPNACHGCSGRWEARLISAAASAISMPMRRRRSNMRSTGSRWKRSVSSTCSTSGLRDNEYLAGSEYTIADMAIWPWYGGLVKGWLYEAAEFLAVQDYKTCSALGRCDRRAPGRAARADGQPCLWRAVEPAARAP